MMMMRAAVVAWLAAAAGLFLPGNSSAQEAPRQPPAPGLVFAFEARVEVGPPLEVGQIPRGLRRIVPILRGTFEGPGIKGRVMPGGADWQIIGADGFSELDTRFEREDETGNRRLRRGALRRRTRSHTQHSGHSEAHRQRHTHHEGISR